MIFSLRSTSCGGAFGKTMKWRYIGVPLAMGAFGVAALMLVLHVFAKSWDGPGVSPWLNRVAKWDSLVLLAPLNALNYLCPALLRHGNPILTTFLTYGVIGLALVAVCDRGRRMIRKNRRAEQSAAPLPSAPAGPSEGAR